MSTYESDTMNIINRKGETEEFSFDEIKNRIKRLINFSKPPIFTSPLTHVNPHKITFETISKLYDGITTRQLDTESAKVCASLETVHHNYGLLGGRILASDHHKHLKSMDLTSFVKRHNYLNEKLPNFFDPSYIEFINTNAEQLNLIIDTDRDYLITYFGFKTLEKSYLIKYNDEPIETPQDMFLRVAIAIHHRSDIDKTTILELIAKTYNLTSLGYFTHATPTLFNAGTRYEQMSSCYLLGTDDSLDGIYKTISDSAKISKWAGGIGIHVSNIRAHGSKINSTNGNSDGIVPMLKVYNEVARHINQGGKRKGSIAIYLEPWHADIEGFLDIKKNTGAETERARDLFTAMWIPDEFMRRVMADDDWFLMCPNECPGLTDVYDSNDEKTFTTLYNSYIAEGKYRKKMKAQTIFHKIMESQVETGVPYILFKDNINRKSNQSNIGIIKSSNLCAEICEVSSADEYAVCNLGSIAVNKFINSTELAKFNTYDLWLPYHNITDSKTETEEEKLAKKEFKLELQKILKSVYDFDKLREVTSTLTYNLNNIIDYNFYPVPETAKSNLKNRPIGIGIQGLGDLYYMLNIPYSSFVAKYIDALIMETINFGALSESNRIAINKKESYKSFEGSPASNGLLQFDLWEAEDKFDYKIYPQLFNSEWVSLKESIIKYGLSNSLTTALMPTATTSQILGNNECFEPYSSNIYKRTTLAGEFQVVNKHLVDKLVDLNLWNEKTRSSLISSDGSFKEIKFTNNNELVMAELVMAELEYMKDVYKTVWEVKQKDIIDHALARAPYVDQSQSMNLFFANPDFKSLYSAIVYGWKNGIKTGCYYLRSKPAVEAIKYSVEIKGSNSTNDQSTNECTMCSS
jgi:ribonucleoside-diphosphate reductase alpha subunit